MAACHFPLSRFLTSDTGAKTPSTSFSIITPLLVRAKLLPELLSPGNKTFCVKQREAPEGIGGRSLPGALKAFLERGFTSLCALDAIVLSGGGGGCSLAWEMCLCCKATEVVSIQCTQEEPCLVSSVILPLSHSFEYRPSP